MFVLNLLGRGTARFSCVLLNLDRKLPAIRSVLFFQVQMSRVVTVYRVYYSGSLPGQV